jgi:AraC-like DNA-binding protein
LRNDKIAMTTKNSKALTPPSKNKLLPGTETFNAPHHIIVERRLAAAAAFRQNLRPGQFFEALFDAVPGAYYFVKDRQSRFMAASSNFAKTLGLNDAEELIGLGDHDFSADFLADIFVADDRQVMETGEALLNKVELVPTEDSLDWLTTSKVPLFANDGSVVGLAGVTRKMRDNDALYQKQPEMHRIVDHIRANFRQEVMLNDLAKVADISASSVGRLFHQTFGLTPIRYIKMTRVNAACTALRETRKSLVEIAKSSGFNDQACMNRDFRAMLNLTPRHYRLKFGKGKRGLKADKQAQLNWAAL